MTGRPRRASRFASKEERLHIAALNDNKGRWYLCHAPYTAASLHHLLETQKDICRVLLNSIGGVLGCPIVYRKTGRIWVQILVPDDLQAWQVIATLSDYSIVIVAGRSSVPEEDQ